jgi:enoyl-CoA hydratase
VPAELPTESVRTEVSGEVAVVCLDRPPVNALDSATYASIAAAFTALAGSGASICVLRSAGRHFCAGNDLNESAAITPEAIPGWLDNARRAFASIHECPIPVIAAVQGAALGSGLQLAASCDLVIAAADARFGLPEITVGMMGGARHLARLVPWPMVRRMFYTGKPVLARELDRVGGLAVLVPADESAADVAIAFARDVAASGVNAMRTAKRSLTAIESMELAEGYAFEASLTRELLLHAPESRKHMSQALGGRAQ